MAKSSTKLPQAFKLADITTYQSGVVQASAFRIVKKYTDKALSTYSLTSMQWFTIGMVLDNGRNGIRISDLALKLDTTLAYMTTTVNMLESRRILTRSADADDARNKFIKVNPSYIKQCHEIERDLRAKLRELLYQNILHQELAVYVAVLYKITELGKRAI